VVFVQANASKVAYKGAKIKVGANLVSSVSEDAITAGRFDLYPNPVSEQATLRLELLRDSEVSVEITNLAGQTMQIVQLGQLSEGNHTHTLDMSQMAAGMYFIKTKMNDQVAIKRIVKQ
jgi:hypothetical protein